MSGAFIRHNAAPSRRLRIVREGPPLDGSPVTPLTMRDHTGQGSAFGIGSDQTLGAIAPRRVRRRIIAGDEDAEDDDDDASERSVPYAEIGDDLFENDLHHEGDDHEVTCWGGDGSRSSRDDLDSMEARRMESVATERPEAASEEGLESSGSSLPGEIAAESEGASIILQAARGQLPVALGRLEV